MLYKGKLEWYQCRDTVSELSLERYRAFYGQWNALLDKELPSPDLEDWPAKVKALWLTKDMILDDEDLASLCSFGIEVTIKKVKGVQNLPAAAPFEQKVYQISVANVGLMQISRVEVLEDICTEELQRVLDKGWRILAVCPPNDARRPTYIVGHTDREVDLR